MMPLATPFDTIVIVDWSAASAPSPRTPSADAIWIALAGASGEQIHYCRTRADAEQLLIAAVEREVRAERRVLLGFDFPFGYPKGFAREVTGQDGALVFWEWLEPRVSDGPDNRNDRFALAAQINRAFRGVGPFWGHPVGQSFSDLPMKGRDRAGHGMAERRRVEDVVPRAQPVWKLYTTGSVGSQTLMGLPMLERLRRRFGASAWPFEPVTGRVVLAEVYPSLIDPAVWIEQGNGMIKDAAQVRLLARAFERLQDQGGLTDLFGDIPDWPGRADEGWILGAGHQKALLQVLE